MTMVFTRLSLRTAIALAIGLMGLVGLLLAMTTGEVYRELNVEHERSALTDLLRLETTNQVAKHLKHIGELGLAIQHENAFKEAVQTRNDQKIVEIINSQFFQYYVTANILRVAKIIVYDANYEPLVASSEGVRFSGGINVCQDFIERMRQRNHTDALKTHGDFCEIDGYAYHVAINPIGTLKPIGFIGIFVDPRNIFDHVEQTLGMPVMVDLRNEINIYLSERWSNQWLEQAQNEVLIAAYPYRQENGDESFHIHLARDNRVINAQLNKTRLIVLIVSVFVTGLCAVLALILVDKSIIKPLSQLRSQLQRVHNDKNSLGEEVVLHSHPEIQTLASDFNSMSVELKKLYQSLETMAYTDPLTKLANRSQLGRSLEYYVYLYQKQQTPFALFLMDLNRFKSVNDTLGHHAGDNLLQQVSQRLRQALRKSDIVAAVTSLDTDLFPNDTLARMGGDEFAAVLPAVANVEDTIKIAKKVLDEMRTPFITKGHSFAIGISIGIVLCPTHGQDPSILMHRADMAMYKAKNTDIGWCVFSDDLDEKRI